MRGLSDMVKLEETDNFMLMYDPYADPLSENNSDYFVILKALNKVEIRCPDYCGALISLLQAEEAFKAVTKTFIDFKQGKPLAALIANDPLIQYILKSVAAQLNNADGGENGGNNRLN